MKIGGNGVPVQRAVVEENKPVSDNTLIITHIYQFHVTPKIMFRQDLATSRNVRRRNVVF